jgi:DNA-binding NarL/FixJ family response regulator
VRAGLKRIIEEVDGYKVIGETGDGLQILPLIRELRPDMIILSISMSNLRGIEVVPKIRRVDKGVKILILTRHKNEEYVYQCLVAGAQGYALKEDTDKELISAIEAIRDGKIYISPSFSSEVIKKLIQSKGDFENKTPFKILTNREREVLKLIAEGNSNKVTATKLGISVRTIEHHRSRIIRKLGVSNTVDLVRYALKNGFVDWL